MMWFGNIIQADNEFYTKNEEYLRAKYLEGAPCLPLNAPLYITLTMVLYENMKPIQHVLLHPICILSHLMCACKHCDVKLSLYY